MGVSGVHSLKCFISKNNWGQSLRRERSKPTTVALYFSGTMDAFISSSFSELQRSRELNLIWHFYVFLCTLILFIFDSSYHLCIVQNSLTSNVEVGNLKCDFCIVNIDTYFNFLCKQLFYRYYGKQCSSTCCVTRRISLWRQGKPGE